MPARYVNVTIDEMREFLELDSDVAGWVEITNKLAGTKETVFAKRVDKDGMQLSLRIYTGINPNGKSRDVGKDAIRVELFFRDDEGNVSRAGHGCKRVHRVVNWRKNLQSRLDAWQNMLGPCCDDCKRPMVQRKGSQGKFWGCTAYPRCKGTKNAA